MRHLPHAVALITLLAVLTACTSATGQSESSSTLSTDTLRFAACPEAQSDAPAQGGLPEITLPCVDGDDTPHSLHQPTGKPRVINLWASWCPPCGEELPAFAQLERDAGEQLQLLGVITEDKLSTAVSAANELDLRFPHVSDADGELRRALGRNALPLTLFLDASGKLTHTYAGPALNDEELRTLVRQHLHVRV